MKRKRFLFAALAIALVFGMALAACDDGSGPGGSPSSGSLAGTTWKCTESYYGVMTVTYTLTFTSSSRVRLEYSMMGYGETYNGTYRVNGSSISVSWDAGYNGSASYTLSGNRLTSSEGNVFIRQ